MSDARAGRAERRRFPRQGFRLPCAFEAGEDRGRGFVTDVSATGLFVQTMHSVPAGAEVTLHLEPHDAPPLTLRGSVARARRGHRAATTVVRPGFGVRLEAPPETWFALLQTLERR